MGKSVEPDCVQAWIADEDFGHTSGGRVPLKDRSDVLPQSSKHFNSLVIAILTVGVN
jgi:hypothetical protein